MPTVLRVAGFHISILLGPREHLPAHVPVWKGGATVVIHLAQDELPQFVVRAEGMWRHDQRRAESIVRDHTSFLLAEFRRIHGKTR